MRILVLGATGMLGHQVVAEAVQRGHQVWGCSRHGTSETRGEVVLGGLDAEDPMGLVPWLDEISPHVVVNAVGLIKQRPEALDYDTLIRVNAWFPRALEFFTESRGIRLIHVSTDCVFDGSRGAYREDDLPNAVDGYGRSKALGEVKGELSLTLRTSIIGPERERRLGLFEWLKSSRGGTVSGYQEAWYSGVTTFYLSRLMIDIMEKFPALRGIYQVASSPISKHELLTRIRDRFDWPIEILGDRSIHINRILDGSRFSRATGIRIPDWSTLIEDLYACTAVVGKNQ